MVCLSLSILFAMVSLSVVCSNASPSMINERPYDADDLFGDNMTPKEAEYVYFGGHANGPAQSNVDFCNNWTFAAGRRQSENGSNKVFAGCKLVDRRHHVAAVWASEAQKNGHFFSQTGPVGYDFAGVLTFVKPQVDAYVSQGGTCHRVTRHWCLDDTVSSDPVDLSGGA